MTGPYPVRDLVYRAARLPYRLLKRIFGPAVRSRPRLHRFAVAIKEATREFIKPPLAVQLTARQPDVTTSCAPAPSVPDFNRTSGLPEWLIEEWREIHEIEPLLFPDPNIQFNVVTDFIQESRVGRHYLDLCSLYGEKVSHVFLVPWLKTGGADLVTLNYVRALSDHVSGAKVVVISTENSDSPWAKKLPAETRFIEFGKSYPHLSGEEKERLLTRVLLQSPPRVIHNINSLLGYNIFIKHGSAIAENSHLFASAFCEDVTREGRSIGYPVCFLPHCFDALTAVFSDNRHILNKLHDIFAFQEEKLLVHYQPMAVESVKRKRSVHSGQDSLDILWASRLDIQKRPDILIKIAERCKDMPFTFHVYGAPVYGTTNHEAKAFVNSLNSLPNVRYYGPFDGLRSIPADNCDVFLYTSQWDGLPNVLLEAVSMGLPVVASATGGIPELIQDGKTGFAVVPFDNIEGYAEALTKVHQDRSVLGDMAGSSLELLKSRHSWDNFTRAIRDVPFYAG